MLSRQHVRMFFFFRSFFTGHGSLPRNFGVIPKAQFAVSSEVGFEIGFEALYETVRHEPRVLRAEHRASGVIIRDLHHRKPRRVSRGRTDVHRTEVAEQGGCGRARCDHAEYSHLAASLSTHSKGREAITSRAFASGRPRSDGLNPWVHAEG